ncbi:hypothetical protein RHSIM_Rhsim03G0213900 [Rhododendron simsii]|uniref:Uncharacterized protein n=1 Tax=Rhododendron simsii TaxID=118357 RepID=A0A834HEV8_RHOSS|nr:hypothetical protein RHSIM_Rhsim03G0213900 [Rhododendron simsii]
MESEPTEQSLLMEIDEEDEEVEVVEEEEAVPTPLVQEPPKIHRLDESAVNRIAAREVIQRPVSPVKELVENSLDAGSTFVNVVVKDGGLKLIQVSDDGHGIRFEDLPILCERHTTSKLSKFEDLQSIRSMGFRGEALASMTYVGHVTVTTITKGQLHGYRDGVMEHEPKACAAVKGTQIMIENLFYNLTTRRKTLQNSADDYPKIVDLLSRFAIHHTNVSFSCRKHGAARADVHSVATASMLDAIRSVYGVSVARNLMTIEASDDDPSSSVFKMDGFISNSNYIAKKITMVLFINVVPLFECRSALDIFRYLRFSLISVVFSEGKVEPTKWDKLSNLDDLSTVADSSMVNPSRSQGQPLSNSKAIEKFFVEEKSGAHSQQNPNIRPATTKLALSISANNSQILMKRRWRPELLFSLTADEDGGEDSAGGGSRCKLQIVEDRRLERRERAEV